jgi:hypothetical protein
MPISNATRAQIEANITRDLFNSDQLDRRGILTLSDLNTDDGTDPFASGSWYNPDRNGSGDGSRSLRAFINSADGRAEIAKTNPEIAAEIAEEQSAEVAEEFVAQTPDFYPDDDYKNYDKLITDMVRVHLSKTRMDPDEGQALLFARGHWTVPNLQAAFARLWNAGHMIPNPGAWKKQLSEDELNRVVSAYSGRCGQEIPLDVGT